MRGWCKAERRFLNVSSGPGTCVLSPRWDVMLEPYRVQRKDRRTPWFGMGVQELNFLDSIPDSPREVSWGQSLSSRGWVSADVT